VAADNPSQLASAAKEFSDNDYTTGLQTGLLTPILNAVSPDDFPAQNNEPQELVSSGYFKQIQ
jgi:5-methylcytosine-specific restriction enzyme B